MEHESITAVVIVQLPVDLEGTPFTLSSNIMHGDHYPHIDFYSCSCGEQFNKYEDAQEHRNES